ncbi:hypothetical protein CBL_00250 [Carabus blaptoides fortunei]
MSTYFETNAILVRFAGLEQQSIDIQSSLVNLVGEMAKLILFIVWYLATDKL